MKSRKQQAGASFFSVLIVLIVAGFLFSIAFKLYPAYTDNLTVESVIEDMVSDREQLKAGPGGLKSGFIKKMRINQVKLPHKDSLVITRKEGVIRFIVDYEVRIPMFYNVDAVVVFKKEYEAIAP